MADASVNIIDWTSGTLQVSVNTGVIQEKLTATSDTTTSKAVLASKTIRSVGVDDTMNIGLTGNVINLAVNKTNIQEKLTSGTIVANDNSADVLVGSKIKGTKGDRGITVSSDAEKLMLTGPPISDWSSGASSGVHYLDTGPTELQVRNASAQPVVRFYSTSKDFRSYGSATVDGDLSILGTTSLFDSVDVVKSVEKPTSGTLQAPTIRAKEVLPISPETSVTIQNINSSSITPPIQSSLNLNGDTIIHGSVVVDSSNPLRVDNITPLPHLDAPTLVKVNGDLEIIGNVIGDSLLFSNQIRAKNADQVTVNDNLTVNGSLVVGTTNVLTAINNLGASQLSPASVYTKTEVDDKLGLKANATNPSFSGTATVLPSRPLLD